MVSFYCPKLVPENPSGFWVWLRPSPVLFGYGGEREVAVERYTWSVWGDVLVAVRCFLVQQEGGSGTGGVWRWKWWHVNWERRSAGPAPWPSVPQPKHGLWERLLLFVDSRTTLLRARLPGSRYGVESSWGRWRQLRRRAPGKWLTLTGRWSALRGRPTWRLDICRTLNGPAGTPPANSLSCGWG